MGPTCQSLSLSSSCFSLCTTVRSNGGEASQSSPLRVAVVEADPVFPAGVVAKSSTTPSRDRHLPHFLLRPAFLFFSFLCSP